MARGTEEIERRLLMADRVRARPQEDIARAARVDDERFPAGFDDPERLTDRRLSVGEPRLRPVDGVGDAAQVDPVGGQPDVEVGDAVQFDRSDGPRVVARVAHARQRSAARWSVAPVIRRR